MKMKTYYINLVYRAYTDWRMNGFFYESAAFERECGIDLMSGIACQLEKQNAR